MALILLIDDEHFILKALSQIIEAFGHTVQTATCGIEARALFKPGIFDAVIADLNLPDTNGLTLLTDFMAEDSEIKSVVITGFSTIQALAQATNEGVNAYITKPFSMAEITSTLLRLFPPDGQGIDRLNAQDYEEEEQEGLFSRIAKMWRPSA